jgi:hypothetical protein
MNKEIESIKASTDTSLHNQLLKLGDMLGDGDCDPWVAKEYKRVAKALGYLEPTPEQKKARTQQRVDKNQHINSAMEIRCNDVPCKVCNGELKQTRSGSLTAVCSKCSRKFLLLRQQR